MNHGHEEAAAHGHAPQGYAHATLQGYLTGFGLSVVLTAIPFWLVMSHAIASPGLTAAIIITLALVQIVVHMVYFLHMNTKSENGWIAMALIFTVILVVIALTGTVWIMHHLSLNMMPMSASDMRNMP